MTGHQFVELAKRLQTLDNRLDWVLVQGHQANGRLRRTVSQNDLHFYFRALETKVNSGLVFQAQVAAVPDQQLGRLKAACNVLNGELIVATGSAIWIEHDRGAEVLWLKTLFPTPDKGFSDEVLKELVDSNFILGDALFNLLAGVHQKALTPDSCAEHVIAILQEFLKSRSAYMRAGYQWSRDKRVQFFDD